jgi:hypothetical protein
MPVFNPPELERRFDTVRTWLENLEVEVEFDDVTGALDVHGASDVTVVPPACIDESITVTMHDLLATVDEFAPKKRFSFDGLVYQHGTTAVVRLQPLDAAAFRILEEPDALTPQAAVLSDRTEVKVGLVRSSLSFVLATIVEDFFFADEYPLLGSYDAYAAINSARALTKDEILDVCHAYLFELGVSAKLMFEPAARLRDEERQNDVDVDELFDRAEHLRPLLVGVGLGPLLREYQRGVSTVSPEIQVLCFVKCAEYVSATVVRAEQYAELRKRLTSSDALSPNAQFMDGLLALCDENRTMKDEAALKLTIERCCDAPLLADLAPTFLSNLRGVRDAKAKADPRQALGELAGCLSATRNQIAHAKANYRATGRECPNDQLEALAKCSRVVAEQCIRWYGLQNPELRRA